MVSAEGGRRATLAFVLPVLLMIAWWAGTRDNPYGLIPPPADVGTELIDLSYGGINDDAFSGTLAAHLLASMGRVYGGFLLAAAIALCSSDEASWSGTNFRTALPYVRVSSRE